MSETRNEHATGDATILLSVKVSVNMEKYVAKLGLQKQFSVMEPGVARMIALTLAQAEVLTYTKENQFLTLDDINESFADRGVSVAMPERKSKKV